MKIIGLSGGIASGKNAVANIFFELGKRKIVSGQEDIILEFAKDLSRRAK